MALSPSQWFANPGAGFDTTLIGNSCWLDGTNDGFTRASGDFDAEDGKEFTIGTWFQQLKQGATGGLLASGDNDAYTALRLDGDGKFYFQTKIGDKILSTDSKWRDTAWYHILVSVDTTQGTAADRVKIFINGVQVALSGTYPDQNVAYNFNVAKEHEVGNSFENGAFNGYVAQSFMIGSKSIQQSDFAITDFLDEQTFGTNGSQKIPKKHSEILTLVNAGSDNSFLLDYSDSAALGTDSSDFTNTFTATSIAAANQNVNTPSLAYPHMTTLSFGEQPPASMALTMGNNLMTYSGGNTVNIGYFNSEAILPTDNPIYWEFYIQAGSVGGTSGGRIGSGLFEQIFDQSVAGFYGAGGENALFYRGALYDNGTDVISGSSFTTAGVGEVQNMAYKPSTGEVWIGVEGTWRNGAATDSTTLDTGNPDHTITASKEYFIGMGANRSGDIGVINFGNNGTFSGNETAGGNSDANGHGDFMHAVPSGFYALNSANRVAPSYQGIDYFKPTLYAGNGTAIGAGGKAITGTGFQSDLVWIKNRDQTDSYGMYDAVRGTTKQIESDTNAVETTETEGLTAFGTDGFTVGSLDQLNTNTENYVAWQFLAGNATSADENGTINSTISVASAGHFSIMKFTGSGADATVGHGLGAAPELVLTKDTDVVSNWLTWHKNLTSAQYFVNLNTNVAQFDNGADGYYRATAPSATIITMNDSTYNTDASVYAVYNFRSVAGVCKVGVYEGNNGTDGPFICTGFKVAWLLVKNMDATNNWMAIDAARDTDNPVGEYLHPNTTAAGADGIGSRDIDFLSNGFKIRENDSDFNGNATYIYMAMAEIGGGGTLPPIYGR